MRTRDEREGETPKNALLRASERASEFFCFEKGLSSPLQNSLLCSSLIPSFFRPSSSSTHFEHVLPRVTEARTQGHTSKKRRQQQQQQLSFSASALFLFPFRQAMQALARSAAAALRRSSTSASSSATAGTRRSMSSGVSLEEEKKQMDLWRVITIVGKKGKEEAKASPGAATSPVFLSFFLFVLSLAPPFRVFFSFPRGLLESLRDALRDGEEKRSRRMRHHLENQRSEMIIVVSLAQSLFFLLRPRPPEKKNSNQRSRPASPSPSTPSPTRSTTRGASPRGRTPTCARSPSLGARTHSSRRKAATTRERGEIRDTAAADETALSPAPFFSLPFPNEFV